MGCAKLGIRLALGERAKPTCEVAVPSLNLNYVGAEAGEKSAAVCAGHGLADIEDANARQQAITRGHSTRPAA